MEKLSAIITKSNIFDRLFEDNSQGTDAGNHREICTPDFQHEVDQAVTFLSQMSFGDDLDGIDHNEDDIKR